MKDIKGYEGLYAVTKDGKVWSYKNKIFLKTSNSRGYIKVNLIKDNKQKHFYIHRLVAMAFIPNPFNLPQVNHKDENKANNHVTNLEWCTQSYNNNYGTGNTRRASKQQKLVYCVELNKIFNGIREAAKELNVSAGNISNCLKGRIQTVGGYHWKYL